MGTQYLFFLNPRYGWDYVAYLQQAGAVYHGERDYTKLSGNQGPAYYPAGHIYHYLVAYWIHCQSEYGEQIVKFLHLCMHSLSIFLACKIAFIYFAEEKKISKKNEESSEEEQKVVYDEFYSSKGQMIAFMLVGVTRDRESWCEMFND